MPRGRWPGGQARARRRRTSRTTAGRPCARDTWKGCGLWGYVGSGERERLPAGFCNQATVRMTRAVRFLGGAGGVLVERAYLHVTRSSVKSGTRSSALSSAELAAASAVVASTRHRSLPTTVGVPSSRASAVTASTYRHDACHVDGRCGGGRGARRHLDSESIPARPRRDPGAISARSRRDLVSPRARWTQVRSHWSLETRAAR